MRIHRRDPRPHEQELLDRQPASDPAITICVDAWHDLSTERSAGFSGAGMIPWSSVMAWARHHQLAPDNADLLWRVIQQLDAARAEREASKAKL